MSIPSAAAATRSLRPKSRKASLINPPAVRESNRRAISTAERFERRPRKEWEHQLEESFDIFQGSSTIPVTLRFNEFRSRWVREQLWHPAQQLRETEDGGIEITFPVADFREVKMMILQFGADVRVVSPAELREEIAAEAERMRGMYGC